MKVIVDADASPVKNEIIALTAKHRLKLVLVMSIAHYSSQKLPAHVESIHVEKGADQADFKIVQLAQADDIIITQDYGLASLLLAKSCRVIHHQAFEYTHYNIDRLLAQRHFGALERNAGIRTKGPRPFTIADRKKFTLFFDRLLKER